MTLPVDKEIIPLVDALNELTGIHTIQSCCGHRNDAAGREDGQGHLWLRIHYSLMPFFEHAAPNLFRADCIENVSKLYGREAFPVIEIRFKGLDISAWHFERSERSILRFFRELILRVGKEINQREEGAG